jgi:Subtilase family
MVGRAVIWQVSLGVTIALATTALTGMGAQAASPPTSSSYKGGNVILVLRNQHTDLTLTKGSGASGSPRARAFKTDQASLIGTAKGHGAKNLRGFSAVNVVAATVTPAQEAQLASDPAIATVFPDLPLSIPAARATSGAVKNSVSTPVVSPGQTCPADPAHPLLEPEALQTTNTAFSNPSTPQAQKLVDGTGVKVAFIADGLDINNPDFIRANGTHVFVDYQDFSGDSLAAPTGAAEAFGDASAIAAQGRQTYDLSEFVSAAHPLPAGCTIQIRGVAPGASLIGLKVFGNSNSAPTSRFIEAIDYAVTAGADVLNESFGGNPYPDTGGDPISLADDAAIAAGVTVVASTGDAGVTGTVGSPATSSQVIGVAATTTFRSYGQETGGGFQLSNGTWVNDNISGLSSGGVTSFNRTPDLSAPGDLGWALCTPDLTLYEECSDNDGDPASIQNFGGTSQSSPLTAGAAALVFQAYEQTHHGVRPAPAVVKQILTTTARDLGHPAYEQGSGELDSLKAVQAAMSWKDENGAGTPMGSALTVDKTQLSASGDPSAIVARSLTVTNVGTETQRVTAGTRALMQTVADVKGTTTLNTASAPAYIDAFAIPRSYVPVTFTVGKNVDRLTVLAAGTTAPFALRTILIDPTGAFTAYSIPQGAANGARSEVRYPAPGSWTAYVALSTGSAFNGQIAWEAIQQRFAPIGTVLPGSFTLAPGASRKVAIVTHEPASAGDLSASVQFTGSVSGATSVPLSLRAVVPHRNYTFKGTVTAGNGRGFVGQSQVYYLDVRNGERDLGVGVTPSDTGDLMGAVLTAPDGQTFSWNTNFADGTGIQDYVRAPQAGRWQLAVQVFDPVSGANTSSSYTVAVRYNTVKVSAPTLPHSAKTKLGKGVAVTVPVKITNTGVAPLTYFADPRSDRTGTLALANLGSADTIPLPQPDGVVPLWLLPTHTSAFSVTADAGSQGVNLDLFWQGGNPDTYSAAPAGGGATTAGLTANEVTPGIWAADLGQTGPFSAPAPEGSVTIAAMATGKLFDTDVTTSTGDYQTEGVAGQSASSPVKLAPIVARIIARHRGEPIVESNDASSSPAADGPLTLGPGQSATILVTITPSGAKGSVVNGHLYIDTFDGLTGNSDELIGLPYSYTIN